MIDIDEKAPENDELFQKLLKGRIDEHYIDNSKGPFETQAELERHYLSFKSVNRCCICGEDLKLIPGMIAIIGRQRRAPITVLYYCHKCYDKRSESIKSATLADFML